MKNVKRINTSLISAICMISLNAHSSGTELFIDQFPVLPNETYASSSATAVVPAGVVVIAQSSTSSSVGTEIDNVKSDASESQEDLEERFEDQIDLFDQYSLPRSAAPVAVDSSLQTSSPIGHNSQKSLSRPEGVRVDAESGFFPSITIGISREINPVRVEKNEKQEYDEDWVLTVAPQIVYRSSINNRHAYEVGVATQYESYDEFTNLDSNSWSLFGALNLNISEKVQGDLYADHTEGNDSRGGTASRILDVDEENDEYVSDTLGGRVTFGRRSNTLQFLLRAENSSWDYTNNNQDSRDRNNFLIGSGVYWNVGPKTSLFVNLDQTDIDYDQQSSSGFDSTETRNTIGIGWEPTFYTSLIFEIGNLKKDLKDPTLTDYDDTTYSGRINWSPTDRSNIGLYASQLTEESTDFESPYILSDILGVDFSYMFTDRFRGNAYYNVLDDDLVDVRQDDTVDFGVGVFYDVARWITLGAGWSHTERESTDPGAEYDYDNYHLTIGLRANKRIDFQPIYTGDQPVSE
jgi:hypothetical protein